MSRAPAPTGRSHPQLQELDVLKGLDLTYNGWQADVRKAEDLHLQFPSLFNIMFAEHMLVKQSPCTTHEKQRGQMGSGSRGTRW